MALAQKPAPPPAPTQERVNIHGIPPKPDMAPEPLPSEDQVTDATLAEMTAGRKALAEYEQRANAEHEYGKRIAARSNVTREGKEE